MIIDFISGYTPLEFWNYGKANTGIQDIQYGVWFTVPALHRLFAISTRKHSFLAHILSSIAMATQNG